MKHILITGSAGLVGSALALYYDSKGWSVTGVDNNARAEYFGPEGSTGPTLLALRLDARNYHHECLDVRDKDAITALVRNLRPHAIVHCAAQPAHEWSKIHPFDDFEINTVGTMVLLEAARLYCPDSPFVFLSSSKVYGDSVNDVPRKETATRYVAKPIDETLRVDQSLHSPYGASKAAADIMVQEYGRCFGMPTVCLRPNCMTGQAHAGVEMHGFLNYLVRAAIEKRRYRVFGFGGKQVRDNIHSSDVVKAIECCVSGPPDPGAVFNIGGGLANSVSILEAAESMGLRGFPMLLEDGPPRTGDHVCYVSDTRKFRTEYPGWNVTVSLEDMFDEMIGVLAQKKEMA